MIIVIIRDNEGTYTFHYDDVFQALSEMNEMKNHSPLLEWVIVNPDTYRIIFSSDELDEHLKIGKEKYISVIFTKLQYWIFIISVSVLGSLAGYGFYHLLF